MARLSSTQEIPPGDLKTTGGAVGQALVIGPDGMGSWGNIAGASALTPIRVSGPDTRTAVAGDLYFYDVSGGAVALTTPLDPILGQRFGFVFVGGPVGPANGIVVTAAGGTTIAQPNEQLAPGPATTTVQGATAVFNLPGDLGSGAIWVYDGTSKWVMQP